jgi:hypothetical protein
VAKADANAIHIALEIPHGPTVETLLKRGFNVYALNLKQLDRFRDPFSPAGAGNDSSSPMRALVRKLTFGPSRRYAVGGNEFYIPLATR